MPMNFLHSPIWGITGRLSSWQKQDAQNAKNERLEREGKVGEEEKHVREGHANRRELLEWGTRVTAEGWRERRGVVDMIKRCPSPLKRRTSRDFEEVYKVENEIARRRTLDEEGEMIFEEAMEKARLKREREAERKRREQERHDELWTPKDVTMRDSGIGATEDGERRRNGSEEGRPRDELLTTHQQETNRDESPIGMTRAELETANQEVEHLKEEVEKLARRASIEEDISNIKRSQSILDVRDQEARNAAAEKRKVEKHTIRTINRMQDIEDARNRADTTESTHPHIVGARLVRGESARFVDGKVEADVPDHQAHIDMLQAAQALLDEILHRRRR